MAKCRSKDKWASYEKSKTDANLTTSTSIAKSEPFLFSVIHSDHFSDSTLHCAITVNVPSAN
jgi:hypothetical protein